MPKHVATGVGDDGRSRVLEVRELTGLQPDGRIGETLGSSIVVSTLPQAGPDALYRDLRRDLDLEVPPSGSLWIAAWMPPDRRAVMHWTATVDFNTVVTGDVTIVLEDGEAHLDAGDTLLVPGVVHAWRPGPQGCLLAAVLLHAGP